MNKNRLLALALAALPVGAFASDVEIYGKLTGAIESTHTTYSGESGNTTTKVESYDSYIGFKGNEDLGNGLKAIWQVEQNIQLDGSRAQQDWASRETFVGLSGAWGTVQAGYLDNFQRKYSRLDPHKATGWAGLQDANVNYAAESVVSRESLVQNALAYTSPEWNGLTARVLYSAAGESRSVHGSSENVYEIGLRYARDGFYGQYAYTRGNNAHFDGWSIPDGPGGWPIQARAHYVEAGYEANGWLAAVTYINQQIRSDAFTDPDLGPTTGFSFKSRAIGVNIARTFGRWTPHFQYQHAWQPSDFSEGSYYDSTGESFNQYILGVDYALSKRTELQAAAGYMKSGNDPQYNKPHVKGHSISLGLSHSF